jgi:hypothetical protein
MKLDLRRILKNSVRLYFAPITGAYRAVRNEANRISREQHRQTEKRA